MQDIFSEFRVSDLRLVPHPQSPLEVVVEGSAPDHIVMAATQAASMSYGGNSGDLVINTTRGEVRGLLTQVPGESAAVIWMGGHIAGGNGPGGLFADLAASLKTVGVSSLRLNRQSRGGFEEGVLDLMVCVALLKAAGLRDVILVGNQAGGAAAIAAAALIPEVKAVAALGTKINALDLVERVSPRPLLLLHGGADPEEAPANSEQLFAWAKEPKELVIYSGSGFFFNEVHDEVEEKLGTWLADCFGKGEAYRQRNITKPGMDGDLERAITAPDGRTVKITLTRRGLLDIETEALVSPVASWLDIRTTVVGRKLIEDMGDEPYWQLREQAPLLLGEVGVTDAGRLKARYVIHAVTAGESDNDKISNEALVFAATANSFSTAYQRRSRRIALPALGTGFRGTPPEMVAHIMMSVLVQHLQQPDSMNEIVFSMASDSNWHAFADQINALPARLEAQAS